MGQPVVAAREAEAAEEAGKASVVAARVWAAGERALPGGETVKEEEETTAKEVEATDLGMVASATVAEAVAVDLKVAVETVKAEDARAWGEAGAAAGATAGEVEAKALVNEVKAVALTAAECVVEGVAEALGLEEDWEMDSK